MNEKFVLGARRLADEHWLSRMFNGENEMLGFEKAAEILPETAEAASQEIVDFLVNAGENRANGRPPDDDVTFVLVKVAERSD